MGGVIFLPHIIIIIRGREIFPGRLSYPSTGTRAPVELQVSTSGTET